MAKSLKISSASCAYPSIQVMQSLTNMPASIVHRQTSHLYVNTAWNFQIQVSRQLLNHNNLSNKDIFCSNIHKPASSFSMCVCLLTDLAFNSESPCPLTSYDKRKIRCSQGTRKSQEICSNLRITRNHCHKSGAHINKITSLLRDQKIYPFPPMIM